MTRLKSVGKKAFTSTFRRQLVDPAFAAAAPAKLNKLLYYVSSFIMFEIARSSICQINTAPA